MGYGNMMTFYNINFNSLFLFVLYLRNQYRRQIHSTEGTISPVNVFTVRLDPSQLFEKCIILDNGLLPFTPNTFIVF